MKFDRPIRAVWLAMYLLAGVASAQPVPSDVTVTLVAGGFSNALAIATTADASDRIFVAQQGGVVRVVRGGVVNASNFVALDAGTQCRYASDGGLQTIGLNSAGSEQGLLGLAFHPQYQSNGRVFLSWTDANGDSIVARMTNADPADDTLSTTDQQSCLVLLHVDQDFANHNGGNIVFGPDGYLYLGLGDGGSLNDPCGRGQTLDPANLSNSAECGVDGSFTARGGDPASRALLGKFLRIDADGTTPAGTPGLCGRHPGLVANYSIPAGNPFAGNDPQNGCDEVWLLGMRNPWRWSFDRSTGDLIVADVGQDAWEEVSLFPAVGGFLAGQGANADWNLCEGRNVRGSCTTLCEASQRAEVILQYRNSGNCPGTQVAGCSITGGYRYRGPDPILQGVYFFGDACNNEIHYAYDSGGNTWADPNGTTTLNNVITGTVRAFGEDPAGVVYVTGGSNLYRIGAAGRPTSIFRDGFE